MSLALISAAGFVCAFAGSIAGFFASAWSKRSGVRTEGALSGFTAGILIAFICFKMLAEGFAAAQFCVGTAGLLSGAAAAVLMDGAISAYARDGLNMPFTLAVIIHHLTEGLALGALWAASPAAGAQMAAVITVHIIPEASAVFMPSEKCGTHPALICTMLSLPVAVGCLTGMLLTGFGGALLSVSLTFSAGLMLYFTCGQMLPAAKRLTDARYTAIFAAAGFILGVVITA